MNFCSKRFFDFLSIDVQREIRDTLPQIVSLSSGSLLKTVVHKLVAEGNPLYGAINFYFITRYFHSKLPHLYLSICNNTDHSPITMTDLLVLLHDIDCTDNEELMKAIIKGEVVLVVAFIRVKYCM